MKTFNHNKFASVAIAVGVAFFATGAQADEANAVTVRYSDLKPYTAAGAEMLYERIRAAAHQVCGEVDGRQLERAVAVKTCLDQAIENSVHSVNNAQLTKVAKEHGYGVRSGITVASAG